jgi:hypothetical protein
MAYILEPSELSTALPARSSGSRRRSRTARLSASATTNTGASPSFLGTCAKISPRSLSMACPPTSSWPVAPANCAVSVPRWSNTAHPAAK